jgi:serine/threonine-protein kinase
VTKIKLDKQEWVLGPFLASGTYGKVYLGESASGDPVAIKLITNRPGANRELLFDGAGRRNVIPIIDSGMYGNDYAIVMPRAGKSLRKHLEDSGGTLPLEECVKVLTDVATALNDLDGGIVHRDLKPENVLRLNGAWHLADFGTARFADAETETHTGKYIGTTAYLAPERWRLERAEIAADVYAVGIMAFEMFSGARPFPGPDFREQHLRQPAPALTNAPTPFATLVAACLYKSRHSRPTPADLLTKLGKLDQPSRFAGLTGLAKANQGVVAQRAAAQAHASTEQDEKDRRLDLLQSAQESFALISGEFRTALTEEAPDGSLTPGRVGWIFQLGDAELHLSAIEPVSSAVWRNGTEPPFDVIAHAALTVKITPPVRGYAGRKHSLWFCDAQQAGQYRWFETAFMTHPMKTSIIEPYEPFAMGPDATSRAALGPSTAVHQVAWPFTEVEAGDLEAIITRWANWLTDAHARRLTLPANMPERPVAGTWRSGAA